MLYVILIVWCVSDPSRKHDVHFVRRPGPVACVRWSLGKICSCFSEEVSVYASS